MPPKTTKNTKSATLADIAADTGVSVSTVSLVLRNKVGVGPETRRRVFDAAASRGYIHSESNQAQDRRLPKNLGLFVKTRPDDEPAMNNFYAPVLSGIETVCRRLGINLLFTNLPVDAGNNPAVLPRSFVESDLDGALMVGVFLNHELSAQIRSKEVPVVLVDAYAEGNGFDSVITDNFAGAYSATQFLIQAGHKNIGIVGSQEEAYPSVRERRAGYLSALDAQRLSPYFGDCLLRPEEAPAALAKLLTEHSEVTGIFACNDEVAIAAVKTAVGMGRRIPQDLSIVGFDNIALTPFIDPPLTTMKVDMLEMGRLAVNLFLNRFEFPEGNLIRSVIRPKLIARGSVTQIS